MPSSRSSGRACSCASERSRRRASSATLEVARLVSVLTGRDVHAGRRPVAHDPPPFEVVGGDGLLEPGHAVGGEALGELERLLARVGAVGIDEQPGPAASASGASVGTRYAATSSCSSAASAGRVWVALIGPAGTRRASASTDCLTIRPRLGSPLSSGGGERLGLLERDVRRQRRDLRIGDRLDHDRPVGGERVVPGGADLAPGRSTRMPVEPDQLARSRRRGSRAASCEASNFGSPSIARCSQVTWFRSLVVEHQHDEPRIAPALASTWRR